MSSYRMQILERSLFSCGLTCALVFLALHVEREWFQYRYSQALSRAEVTESPPSPPPSKQQRKKTGEVLGKIEIKRLGISAVVVDGEDDRTLRRAVGHLPDTAYPGEKGRMVLAAHRDTFFRNLKGVRKGDVIRFNTPSGRRDYVVERKQVVDPDTIEVIQATRREMLTLVTCYPFDYVGSAPRRFVVHAKAVSGRRR